MAENQPTVSSTLTPHQRFLVISGQGLDDTLALALCQGRASVVRRAVLGEVPSKNSYNRKPKLNQFPLALLITYKLGVVGWCEGAVYLTSLGRPTDIGLQLGKACYPCSG